MHVWVATCVGRLISQSVASGLLKGSEFGCLFRLNHIIPSICLPTKVSTLDGTYIDCAVLEIFASPFIFNDLT